MYHVSYRLAMTGLYASSICISSLSLRFLTFIFWWRDEVWGWWSCWRNMFCLNPTCIIHFKDVPYLTATHLIALDCFHRCPVHTLDNKPFSVAKGKLGNTWTIESPVNLRILYWSDVIFLQIYWYIPYLYTVSNKWTIGLQQFQRCRNTYFSTIAVFFEL